MKDARFDRLKKLASSVVQPFEIKFQEAHAQFISAAWPGSNTRKDLRYLSWKFRAGSDTKIGNLLLAFDRGKVVGQLGLIPSKIKLNNRIYEAQWGCNFKVLQELEGAGFGSLLDIKSLEKKPITLGAGASRQSEEIKLRLGFKPLEGPRKMVYPIDFFFVLNLKLAHLPAIMTQAAAGLMRLVYSIRYFKNYYPGSDKDISKGTYRDIISLIQQARLKISWPHVVHDEDYLHWRCQKMAPYREDARALYTPSGSFILYNPSSSHCHLYEYYFFNDRERRALLKTLLSQAKKLRSKGLYAYVNDSEDEKEFQKFGFLSFRNRVKVWAWSADPEVQWGEKFHMNFYDSDGGI